MKAAGIGVETDDSGLPTVKLEVSPLFATDAESFAASWNALETKPAIADGLFLK